MPQIFSMFSRIHKNKLATKRIPRQQPASTGLRCFPLRLGPGVELISTIHELMEDINIDSLFILSCVGTISQCSLTNKQLNNKQYDIVSLTGTFDSQSHHLMGSFADQQTGNLIGGKVYSLTVDKTCELMLAQPLDCIFQREFDSRTGQNELVIRRKILTDS